MAAPGSLADATGAAYHLCDDLSFPVICHFGGTECLGKCGQASDSDTYVQLEGLQRPTEAQCRISSARAG